MFAVALLVVVLLSVPVVVVCVLLVVASLSVPLAVACVLLVVAVLSVPLVAACVLLVVVLLRVLFAVACALLVVGRLLLAVVLVLFLFPSARSRDRVGARKAIRLAGPRLLADTPKLQFEASCFAPQGKGWEITGRAILAFEGSRTESVTDLVPFAMPAEPLELGMG